MNDISSPHVCEAIERFLSQYPDGAIFIIRWPDQSQVFVSSEKAQWPEWGGEVKRDEEGDTLVEFIAYALGEKLPPLLLEQAM